MENKNKESMTAKKPRLRKFKTHRLTSKPVLFMKTKDFSYVFYFHQKQKIPSNRQVFQTMWTLIPLTVYVGPRLSS